MLLQEIQTGNLQIISFQFPQQRVLILHLDHIPQLEVVMAVQVTGNQHWEDKVVVVVQEVVVLDIMQQIILIKLAQVLQGKDLEEVMEVKHIILEEVEEQEKSVEVLLLQQEVHMVEKEKRLIF